MKNKAYVIMGASGAGKDTLGKCFKKYGIPKLISNTSRNMRVNEQEGIDYYFRKEDDISEINLINRISYAGNSYGYAKDTVAALSHCNDSFYAVATVDGYNAIKQSLPNYEVIGIYMNVSENALKSRMMKRGSTGDEINSRLGFLRNNQRLEEKAKKVSTIILDENVTIKNYDKIVSDMLTKDSKKLAYISGKMTGTEDYGREKFSKAKIHLMNKGYEVFSPADIGYVDGWDWDKYMKYDLAKMTQCDIVFMLDDWKDSTGATIEYNLAKDLNIPIEMLDLGSTQ